LTGENECSSLIQPGDIGGESNFHPNTLAFHGYKNSLGEATVVLTGYK